MECECIDALSSLAIAMRLDGMSDVRGERLQPMGDMGSVLPAHLHIYIYGIDFL